MVPFATALALFLWGPRLLLRRVQGAADAAVVFHCISLPPSPALRNPRAVAQAFPAALSLPSSGPSRSFRPHGMAHTAPSKRGDRSCVCLLWQRCLSSRNWQLLLRKHRGALAQPASVLPALNVTAHRAACGHNHLLFSPETLPWGEGSRAAAGRAGWPFLEGRKCTEALSRLIGFRSERKRRCGPLQPMTFQKCYQRFHSHLAHSCNKVPPAPNATSVPAALGAVASLVTSNLPPIWVSPMVTKH